jgi:hypothetical protein
MNNINIPSEKAELKHFKGYPRYYSYLYEVSGDKYLSDLTVSNKDRLVAISSYGKGVAITNYFHHLIEEPHEIKVKEIENHAIDTTNVNHEFQIKKNPCVIKGRITRSEQIKNAWLYFVKEDKRFKIRVDKKGEFVLQAPLFGESSDYSIIVEDWDNDLNSVQYHFKLTKSD